MDTFNQRVFDRLNRFEPIEPDEIPQVEMAIEDLRQKGWTEGEAFSCLKWLEHVNPNVCEEVALLNMKSVRERVAARMQAEGAQHGKI